MILYLLPGLLCDATVWRHQLAHLSDVAELRVPDFKGFESLTAMAQSVLDEAPERFCVAGHSMGGRVALEMAHLAPQRVAKLALLDTGVHARQEGEAAKRQPLIDLARSRGIAAMAPQWARPMLHPRRQQGPLLDEICAMVARYSLEEYEGQIRALLERPDATSYLQHIACPTLVVCGREDAWSPPQQHEAFAALLPRATLQIIEECGHMATMEQPEAVTEALRAWLMT